LTYACTKSYRLARLVSHGAAIDFKASYGFNPSHAADFQLLTFSIGLTYVF